MKSLAIENLSLIASAPNGVKKLRQLILQLAVMGKLVPQDPKEGRFTLNTEEKNKPKLSTTFDNQTENSSVSLSTSVPTFSIPDTWSCLPLGEIANLKIGKTPSTKDGKFWSSDGIPWVSISDMDHYGHVKTTARAVSSQAVKTVFKYPPMKKGTLIMSFKLTIGKTSFLAVDAFHNEAIVSVLPIQEVSPFYLFRTLPVFSRMGVTKDAVKGATLNSDSLKNIPIMLPPLAEQHRIISKIDELMALCDKLEAQQCDSDAAHSLLVKTLLDTLTQSKDADDFADIWARIKENFHTLFATEESIDNLKQTILQLAVMGKLVSQYPTDEPANKLLMRLRQSRKELLAASLEPEAKTMLQKLSRLKPVSATTKIPQTWESVRVIDLAMLMVDCHNKTAPYVESGIPIIRTSNIRNREFRMNDLRFIDKATYDFWSRRCPPAPQDIIFTREAPMGEAAIIPDGKTFCLGQRTMLIRPMHEFVDNHYLLIALTEPSLLIRALPAAVGATVKHLRVGDVENLEIALPPLAEQRRIVAKVNELMALCDKLKSEISTSNKLQIQINSSMLRVVFDSVSKNSYRSRKSYELSNA